jgi:N-acetylglucosaminyldiphosphoundecaprenol N-acetyl-beta-D-mannosaminyltransferase
MTTKLSSSDAAVPALRVAVPEGVPLMRVTVHPLPIADLNTLVGSAVLAGRQTIIAGHNMQSLYLHRKDPGVRDFYARADFVRIDGMPLVLMGRALGLPLTREHRVTYVDWVWPLMEEAARSGWRVFYLGSAPGVAEEGAARLRKRYPGLDIATRHGYFDVTEGGGENEAVLAELAAHDPDVLIVGMGMPRQQHWIMANLPRLSARVIMPSGACMDYVAGAVPTPPRWMGRWSLEWLYRLATEPGRMWRRYLVEPWTLLPIFLASLRAARR